MKNLVKSFSAILSLLFHSTPSPSLHSTPRTPRHVSPHTGIPLFLPGKYHTGFAESSLSQSPGGPGAPGADRCGTASHSSHPFPFFAYLYGGWWRAKNCFAGPNVGSGTSVRMREMCSHHFLGRTHRKNLRSSPSSCSALLVNDEKKYLKKHLSQY